MGAICGRTYLSNSGFPRSLCRFAESLYELPPLMPSIRVWVPLSMKFRPSAVRREQSASE